MHHLASDNGAPSHALKRIAGLRELASGYDLLLCDVWGVLHNGVRPFDGAIRALMAFREQGGTVVMITNAPRPRHTVKAQLDKIGVPAGVFDAIVTSGDVTRGLMAQAPRHMLHIGPDKDLTLFDGLDVERVEEAAAEAIICTGLWQEQTEKPEDYVDLLQRLKKRDLPLICANPDIVVEVGDHLEYCAGAIAREYDKMGGETLIAGKPYAPIYEAALGEAENLSGKPFNHERVLAIGDGMPTDIKGAADFGLDVLFISAGIHAREYGTPDAPDHNKVAAFLAEAGTYVTAYMPRLDW